jgi:hypothetical protein
MTNNIRIYKALLGTCAAILLSLACSCQLGRTFAETSSQESRPAAVQPSPPNLIPTPVTEKNNPTGDSIETEENPLFLSPSQVVQAYWEASIKGDFAETARHITDHGGGAGGQLLKPNSNEPDLTDYTAKDIYQYQEKITSIECEKLNGGESFVIFHISSKLYKNLRQVAHLYKDEGEWKIFTTTIATKNSPRCEPAT